MKITFFPVLVLLCSAAIDLVAGGEADSVHVGFNILNFGAVPDTTHLSTRAIQAAIDKCHSAGGGRVVIPAGSFRTGSLVLRSYVELYLERGAVLYGSKSIEDYIPARISFESLRTREPTRQLLFAERAVHIAIRGAGEINGQGAVFRKRGRDDEGVGRPHLIRFSECRGVTMEGVTLRNAGAWMQHYLACEEIQIRNIRVFNRVNYNNDGIDIDGCNRVTISDVMIDSDDDGITLKSTSGRICENVVITNCIISSHCNAIKLGTETNGGFKNIAVSNCVIRPSDDRTPPLYGWRGGKSAVSLQIVDGGTMDGVRVSNIVADSATVPLFIRLGNRARPYSPDIPVTGVGAIRNVVISGLQATHAGKTGSSVIGLPGHPVENVILENIRISTSGGGMQADAERDIPALEKDYPEATMFGTLPAYGLFIRDVENITVTGLHVTTTNEDQRPGIVLDRLSTGWFNGNSFRGKGQRRSSILIQNSRRVQFTACLSDENADSFLSLTDRTSSGIGISASTLIKGKQLYTTDGKGRGRISAAGNSTINKN